MGGTFLTWSLHWLSGHDQYYSIQQKGLVDLINDPLTLTNSHKFIANHPQTADQCIRMFDELNQTKTDSFHTVYLHNFAHTTESIDSKMIKCVEQLAICAEKIIVLSNSEPLYHASYRSRHGTTNLWQHPEKIANNADEIFDDFVGHFFTQSKNQWLQLGLTDIWDQREFVALNFDFKNTLHIKPNIDATVDCYEINTMDLFNTFDISAKHLFEYLELPIVQHRWQPWIDIYRAWRQHHHSRLQFVWYFDTIIQAILNGDSFDLTRLQLDLVQEAAIQNTLIYQHNLNLKTWQLQKFTNTKQLHTLLEPNHHDLSKQQTNDSV